MSESCFLFRKLNVLLFLSLAFIPLAQAEDQAKDSDSDWEYLAELYMWGAEVSGKTPSGSPIERSG